MHINNKGKTVTSRRADIRAGSCATCGCLCMSHVSSVRDSHVKLVTVKYVYIFQWSWQGISLEANGPSKAANHKHTVLASELTQKEASGPRHLERDALTILQS